MAAIAGLLLGAIVIRACLFDESTRDPIVGNGWVAFTVESNDPNGPSDIYVVRPGAPERALVGFTGDSVREACPQFSPDGIRIAYLSGPAIGPVHGRDEIRIGTLAPEGIMVGAPHVLAGGLVAPTCPEWSPDGQRVALITGRVDVAGQLVPGLRTVSVIHRDGTSNALDVGRLMRDPDFDWSPGGTAIAYVGDWSIWIAPIDGGEPRRVYEAEVDVQLGMLEWAPDGKRILVTALRRPSAPPRDAATRIIHVDGATAPIELTGFRGITWSPDGQRLAAVRSTTRGTFEWDEIVTMSPDGRDVLVVADEQWAIQGLTWSPDGSELLYVENQGPSPGLLAVAASGGAAPRFLLSRPYSLFTTSAPSWQAVFSR